MKTPHILETAVHDLKVLAEKLHTADQAKPAPATPPPEKHEHPLRDRVEKVLMNLPPGNFPLP